MSMRETPVRIAKYGVMVWANPTLEAIRRDECLCWSCTKLKPGKADNCPIAQELYELCVKRNVATPVSRCPDFEERT